MQSGAAAVRVLLQDFPDVGDDPPPALQAESRPGAMLISQGLIRLQGERCREMSVGRSRRAAQAMIAAGRGGRIINNGSISAHTPRPRAVAYTATKHAVTGLTKQTALDCRGYDIACGQIDIGNAATPLTDRMVAGVLQPDGSTKPEPRMNVDDVGKAVVYMAGLSLDTNVLFMTVMANLMPFIGRG